SENTLEINNSVFSDAITVGTTNLLFPPDVLNGEQPKAVIDMCDSNVKIVNTTVGNGWLFLGNVFDKSLENKNFNDDYNINLVADNLKVSSISSGMYNNYKGNSNIYIKGNSNFENIALGSWYLDGHTLAADKQSKITFEDNQKMVMMVGVKDLSIRKPIMVDDLDPVLENMKIEITNIEQWNEGDLVLGVNIPYEGITKLAYLKPSAFTSAKPNNYEFEYRENKDMVGWYLVKKEVVVQTNDLTIKNTVSGTGANINDEFSFKIEMSVDGTYEYSGDKQGIVKNGDIIKLSQGQTVTINKLPIDTLYKITQIEASQKGYTTTIIGATGTIVKDNISLVEFKNHRDKDRAVILDRNPATGDNYDYLILIAIASLSGILGLIIILIKSNTD
ncbi:MAG: DUF5979 domain-containing protein, partial [Erysipelotrichaceae bacterium]